MILSTMTNDQNVITAGIMHDIVEDTDGTPAGARKQKSTRRKGVWMACHSNSQSISD